MAKEIEMQVFSVQHVLIEGSMRIVATVTVHPRVVQQWINNVSNSLEKVETRVIGLDSEYTDRAPGKMMFWCTTSYTRPPYQVSFTISCLGRTYTSVGQPSKGTNRS